MRLVGKNVPYITCQYFANRLPDCRALKKTQMEKMVNQLLKNRKCFENMPCYLNTVAPTTINSIKRREICLQTSVNYAFTILCKLVAFIHSSYRQLKKFMLSFILTYYQ